MSAAKPKILIVEDHPDIVEIVKFSLSQEGFDVDSAGNGVDGLRKVASYQPALVLLDLMLPQMSGIEVCKELRKRPETKALPIIMLTAMGEETDVVRGLETGADDYMIKPFSPKELAARIRSVLRRVPSAGEKQNKIEWKDLTIDSDRHEVSIGTQKLTLTLTEFRLLTALASQPGRVFTRDQLINRATGGDVAIIDRNIDVHISALRKKLRSYGGCISTVRGIGYRFAE
jgi:two-component system, OmpR family, phosphate regulon response regulator PhoB